MALCLCYTAPVNHLDGLNEKQKEAALHVSGPLLIVAGAGAGKTKTITHRIANLIASGVPAHAILAVTFTNKAAGEMRERVHTLLAATTSGGRQPFIATFHSLGVRLLREFAEEAGIPRAFAIWDRDDSIKTIKRILTSRGLETRFPPRQVLARISKEKGEGGSAEAFIEKASTSYENSIGEVWVSYERALVNEGALDFDDLLVTTLSLLKKRPEVAEKLRLRWTHVTIDEYQDTNRAQYEIARLIAGDAQNLCVVGDVDQCLYSWRGAEIGNLLKFEKNFPGTKMILLEENYRSTQTILTAANAVIEKNVNRFEKKLFTSNPTGDAIELFAGETERDEAFFVARSARELLGSGVKASSIAVLFRENFQSRALEEAFIAEGVPYRVLGTKFFERAEIKDVLAYLRASRNLKSQVDFARAASSPPRGIGKTTLDKLFVGEDGTLSPATKNKIIAFRTLLARIAQSIETVKASEAIRFAIKVSGLEEALAESKDEVDRLHNVFELASHATRYDALPAPEGIERLLEDASLMSDQDELVDKKEAVSLMTVHASKGLEFDAVFVTGLEYGLFPSVRDTGERDPEEERRLFYVALTRARKHLFLTCAGSRLKYGTRESTVPSPFLEDIDQRLITYAHEPQSHENYIL